MVYYDEQKLIKNQEYKTADKDRTKDLQMCAPHELLSQYAQLHKQSFVYKTASMPSHSSHWGMPNECEHYWEAAEASSHML